MTLLAVAIGGGLGAVCRLWLAAIISRRVEGRMPPRAMPMGILAVNLLGSLGLGLVVGLVAGGHLPEAIQAVAGAGFLGGFTTFSTACLETARLIRQRLWPAAVVHLLAHAVGPTAAAAAGLWLAAWA